MKKLFTIAVLSMLALGMNAQEKKSWNFAEGLSEETIANLNADATNWSSNGTDGENNTNNWKNNTKQSADTYWMANGQVIEELRGLKFDIGKNTSNSIHVATTKIRLTRKSTKITFPKLANGQKITIVGRSANGTATNRGIAPVQSYLVFQEEESSPQYNGACIFVGNQVEGSEGTYTFVWKVVTEETDSVDVQFQLTPDAGIDFTLFQIDNGDGPDVEEAQPVAYLYSGDTSSDYAYAYLSGAGDKFALTEIDVTNTTADTDSLRKFQGVVISPTIGADNAYLNTIKQTIAYVPVLNFNPNLYEAWGYGQAVPTQQSIMRVIAKNSAIFEGFDLETTEGAVDLLTDGGVTGVKLGEYFAKDDTIATLPVDLDNNIEEVAMHMHNAKRNAYLLLPLTLADMEIANQDVISQLIPQALQAVISTKKDIVPVSTPVITPKLENGYTTVTITAANSKAIYYTIDGSDPTIESTRYEGAFTLTDSVLVKAFATGDGYTDSKIAEKGISIKVQAKQPTITLAREAGKTTITLSTDDPDVSIYFNFNGAKTSALSQVYTEPIVINEIATISTLAEGGNFLPSEIATKFIGIDGIDKNNIRLDTLSHFDANQTDWFINDPEVSGEASPKASAYYFWGKTAWSYYSSEVDHEETLKDITGNDSIVYYYKPDPEALKVINPLNENGWVLKSQGQVLTGELQLAPDAGVGNGATGRFAEEAIDLIGTPSKGVITFGAKNSNEPYTARIETTAKLAGPFDVIVYCGNGNNSGAGVLEIQTSADGETWTTLDTLKMASTQRYIKRTRASYNETAEVFVRVAQVSGGTKAQVYDIFVMNNGEYSQQYDEEALGITNVQPEGDVVRTEIFSLSGTRMANSGRGMLIIRKTYANGAVVTRKAISK